MPIPTQPAHLPRPGAIRRATPAGNLIVVDALLMLSQLTLGVVLPWWITDRGGASTIAIYSAAIAVATLVAMPLASPFGDRYCKALQIRWGTVVLIGSGAALAVLAATNTFDLAMLIALGFVQVNARAFVDPAREVILTELVPSDGLPEWIRVRKVAQAISGIAGPLVAGLVLDAFDVPGALCAYAVMLGLALVFALRLPRRPADAAHRGGMRAWWDSLSTGLAAKWRVPLERGWTIVNFIAWIFQGPAVGMLIPIKVHSLDLAGDWLGISMGALALGVLLGSLAGAQFLVARFGRYRVRIVVGVTEGIALAVAGFVDSPHVMTAALVVVGFCNACLGLIGATHRALAVPQAFRTRMYAATQMSTQFASVLGPALVGLALTRWSVDAVYTAAGLLMATSVLGFVLVPRFKEFLSTEHRQVVDWYALQYPEVFRAPAPRAASLGSNG